MGQKTVQDHERVRRHATERDGSVKKNDGAWQERGKPAPGRELFERQPHQTIKRQAAADPSSFHKMIAARTESYASLLE